MENSKMQQLASRYVKREITMAQYCDGVNRLMRQSKNKLESFASADANYTHKNRVEQGR